MEKIKICVLFMLAVLGLSGCGNQNIMTQADRTVAVDDVQERMNDLPAADVESHLDFPQPQERYGKGDTFMTESAPTADKVENIIRSDIIDVDAVSESGGIIEFAGEMSYKEFLELNWVSDVDNTLSEDAGVYIVKIYYPDGFEHYKVGMIEDCEAIGIYRAGDGEYLGGSFRQRTP